MSFNSKQVKSYAQGALAAFNANGGSWNNFSGSSISLNTKVAGSVTSTAGLVIPVAGPQFAIEWDSLVALVQTAVNTSTITVLARWEMSPDNTNWAPIYPMNGAANVVVAAAGTGSTVYTTYWLPFQGLNPAAQYLRVAAVNAVVTGGASDAVIVSYFWRKRTAL